MEKQIAFSGAGLHAIEAIAKRQGVGIAECIRSALADVADRYGMSQESKILRKDPETHVVDLGPSVAAAAVEQDVPETPAGGGTSEESESGSDATSSP